MKFSVLKPFYKDNNIEIYEHDGRYHIFTEGRSIRLIKGCELWLKKDDPCWQIINLIPQHVLDKIDFHIILLEE